MTPMALFQCVWFRCEQLSALEAYLANHVTGVLKPAELLRSEWVSRVAALDLYVHDLVAQQMLAIFESKRLPSPGYLRFMVSAETMQRIRVAPSPVEASAAFDLEVRNRLSYQTFQAPDGIADGVRLFSPIELWNEVAMQLGATEITKTTNAKNIRRELSLIVSRRNKIAHEGDLQPTHPRDPWPINQSDLVVVADLVERIVQAIDMVV